MGARIIGGCCGTTPEHIRAIAEATKKLHPEQHAATKTFDKTCRGAGRRRTSAKSRGARAGKRALGQNSGGEIRGVRGDRSPEGRFDCARL